MHHKQATNLITLCYNKKWPWDLNEMLGRGHKCFSPACFARALDKHVHTFTTMLSFLITKLPRSIKQLTTVSSCLFSMKFDALVVQSCNYTLHFQGTKHMPNEITAHVNLSGASCSFVLQWSTMKNHQSNLCHIAFRHFSARCLHPEDLLMHPSFYHRGWSWTRTHIHRCDAIVEYCCSFPMNLSLYRISLPAENLSVSAHSFPWTVLNSIVRFTESKEPFNSRKKRTWLSTGGILGYKYASQVAGKRNKIWPTPFWSRRSPIWCFRGDVSVANRYHTVVRLCL